MSWLLVHGGRALALSDLWEEVERPRGEEKCEVTGEKASNTGPDNPTSNALSFLLMWHAVGHAYSLTQFPPVAALAASLVWF